MKKTLPFAILLCAVSSLFLAGCQSQESPDERLETAIRSWEPDDAKAAIEAGANVNAIIKHSEPMPMLSFALSRGDMASAILLIERGADVNQVDTHGIPALVYLIEKTKGRNLTLLRSVLAKKPLSHAAYDPGLNEPRRVPLLAAIRSTYDPLVVRELLRAGADPNVRCGDTNPLLSALYSPATVRVLLEAGAQVTPEIIAAAQVEGKISPQTQGLIDQSLIEAPDPRYQAQNEENLRETMRLLQAAR